MAGIIDLLLYLFLFKSKCVECAMFSPPHTLADDDYVGHDGHAGMANHDGQDGHDGETNIDQTGSPCILCSPLPTH